MNNQYKLIMFDMDGTFISSRDFHTSVFYRFFHDRAIPVTVESVRAGMGNTVREIFQSVDAEEEQFPELFSQLDRFCRLQIDDLVQEIPIEPSIWDVLDHIKEHGIKTAVVSNSMQGVVERILEYHDLIRCFDYVSGANLEDISKNNRCREVSLQCGAEPRQVLYVGDAESDIAMSNELGYDSCFADTAFSWCRDREYMQRVLRPCYTVKTLKELTIII